MLQAITYRFPRAYPDFFVSLQRLFGVLPHCTTGSDAIVMTPAQPDGVRPLTRFVVDDCPAAGVTLDADSGAFDDLVRLMEPSVTEAGQQKLPLTELVDRLRSHVKDLDHTGVNIPSARCTRQEWDMLMARIGRQTNAYAYPTGEPWVFVVPATAEEYAGEISGFVSGRAPRFELVYDEYYATPTIQIDIETDLTRREAETLFPAPQGISYPNLADFFRTVYVETPWVGLAVRFDIRFPRNQPNDWTTGEWLVKSGRRIF